MTVSSCDQHTYIQKNKKYLLAIVGYGVLGVTSTCNAVIIYEKRNAGGIASRTKRLGIIVPEILAVHLNV